MGYGQHNNNIFANTMSRKLPAPEFQRRQRRHSMPETVPNVLRKSQSTGGILKSTPLYGIPSRTELPAELKRRRDSHRRSIYSIDFEIEASGADDSLEPRCRDGGYGWVVVMAVHLIQVMSMGFLTSLGIFYVEWQQYFDSSAAAAGLVVSMSSVVLGITTVGFARLVGHRPLVFAGTIIVFLGLMATAYAESIIQLTFTVGVLTAFGYGMVVSPAIVVVGDYFEDKFALANGISFSGVSIGQLLWPPLCVDFIYRFGGWRGAIFMIGTITLHMAVFGALLRPVKKKKSKKVIQKLKSVEAVAATIATSNAFEKGNLPAGFISATTITSSNFAKEDDPKYNIASTSSTPSSHEYSSAPTSHYMKRSVSFATVLHTTEVTELQTVDTITETDDVIFFTAHEENAETVSDTESSHNFELNQNLKDQNPPGFLKDIPRKDDPSTSAIQSELPILNLVVCGSHILPLEDDSKPKIIESEQRFKFRNIRGKFKETMANIISFLKKSYGIPGVFLSPLCVMMIPAIVCLGTGWYATITYQAARAMSKGISETDASFLLSLMGIGSLVGRAGHGWFIDKGFITNEMLLVLCLAASSASTYLICFVNLFPVVALLATLQGTALGISNTLLVGIMKTFAKPNFEETAVGILYTIWGVGDLIGGVVAGYLYDLTGDYNVAFYFAASAFALTMIQVYLAYMLKDRIIAKLYAKFQQRQMKGGTSDKLNDMDRESTEEYDNPVFVTDDYIKEIDIIQTINEVKASGNVRVNFQRGISDLWEKASCLEDTNV